MDALPLVSVVIPVYNRAAYVGDAIRSVLAQAHRPLQIIVIDDGSTDDSASVIGAFGEAVEYYYQPNSGIARTRNRGVMLARGAYLAFLDSDDLWSADKLAVQLVVLEARKELDAVFGMVRQFISPELSVEEQARIRCPEGAMAGYVPSAMLIRREAFMRVGLFDTDYTVGEFIAWYLRAIEAGVKGELMQQHIALARRIHKTNIGIEATDAHKDYIRILKASLDRRRGR